MARRSDDININCHFYLIKNYQLLYQILLLILEKDYEFARDIDTIKETIVYLEEEISQGTIDPLTFMENLEIEKVKI